MPTFAACELVTLKGGHVVPLPLLRFCWELEDRGVSLALDGGDILARPARLLTDADARTITQHKAELVQLLACVEVM